MNSIDYLLRKAGKQSEHVVLSIPQNVNLQELAEVMRRRTKRNNRISDIWLYIEEPGIDKCFSRKEITRDNFKIKWN
jgi:hypothetical protein